MWSGNKLIDSGVSMQERVRRHYAPLDAASLQPASTSSGPAPVKQDLSPAEGWQTAWADALARSSVLAEAEAAVHQREAALTQREQLLRQRERALQEKEREQSEWLLWRPTISALSR